MTKNNATKTYYRDITEKRAGVTRLENLIEQLKREKEEFIKKYPGMPTYTWDQAIKDHVADLASLKIELIDEA